MVEGTRLRALEETQRNNEYKVQELTKSHHELQRTINQIGIEVSELGGKFENLQGTMDALLMEIRPS